MRVSVAFTHMAIFRRAFIAASIVWAGLLPLTPFAASRPAPAPLWYALAVLVYGVGRVVCHQLPARSFHLWAAQLPVCARCTGLYLGGAMAAASAAFGVIDPGPRRWSPRLLLGLCALPTALTLIYEWTTGDVPSNAIRALAGAPLGAAVVRVVLDATTEPLSAAPGKVN
jgi:uncharacterized membrane protein